MLARFDWWFPQNTAPRWDQKAFRSVSLLDSGVCLLMLSSSVLYLAELPSSAASRRVIHSSHYSEVGCSLLCTFCFGRTWSGASIAGQASSSVCSLIFFSFQDCSNCDDNHRYTSPSRRCDPGACFPDPTDAESSLIVTHTAFRLVYSSAGTVCRSQRRGVWRLIGKILREWEGRTGEVTVIGWNYRICFSGDHWYRWYNTLWGTRYCGRSSRLVPCFLCILCSAYSIRRCNNYWRTCSQNSCGTFCSNELDLSISIQYSIWTSTQNCSRTYHQSPSNHAGTLSAWCTSSCCNRMYSSDSSGFLCRIPGPVAISAQRMARHQVDRMATAWLV